MPKFILCLFLALSIHPSYAASFESINGPAVLEGVVLMGGFKNKPINDAGQVEHLVLMVIKKVISGQARVDYSLAFSYPGDTQDILKLGDIIRVSFEDNEALKSFNFIQKIGNIYKN